MHRSFAISLVGVLYSGICLGIPPRQGAPAIAPPGTPSACRSDQATSDFQERSPRYQLRAGDVFGIQFEFTPKFNQTVTVQPDGYVTLSNAGDLDVAGCTVPEVTQAIRQVYSHILKDPTISVLLKDFDKPYFIAGGAVGHPGKYELRGDTSVVEAIEMAGGFTDSAKHSQVLLFRRLSRDWMETKILDVKKMLHDKSLKEDIHLQPGDMVFVPESRISKIRRYIPVPSTGVNMNPAIP